MKTFFGHFLQALGLMFAALAAVGIVCGFGYAALVLAYWAFGQAGIIIVSIPLFIIITALMYACMATWMPMGCSYAKSTMEGSPDSDSPDVEQ